MILYLPHLQGISQRVQLHEKPFCFFHKVFKYVQIFGRFYMVRHNTLFFIRKPFSCLSLNFLNIMLEIRFEMKFLKYFPLLLSLCLLYCLFSWIMEVW